MPKGGKEGGRAGVERLRGGGEGGSRGGGEEEHEYGVVSEGGGPHLIGDVIRREGPNRTSNLLRRLRVDPGAEDADESYEHERRSHAVCKRRVAWRQAGD